MEIRKAIWKASKTDPAIQTWVFIRRFTVEIGYGSCPTVRPPAMYRFDFPATNRLAACSICRYFAKKLYSNLESLYNFIVFQSDLDVSASEMEDNVSVPSQLEKVSKEHLYAAYRKSNEKYNKYRGRYTDLARHYKNLERENAKAKVIQLFLNQIC